ncbi:MAG: hypothetical protein RBS08_03690 [Bdellovibrionales bacterium]|jgi:hypothetical protein|nr:hypothetical protein [Bdellovibrionales bacterium]
MAFGKNKQTLAEKLALWQRNILDKADQQIAQPLDAAQAPLHYLELKKTETDIQNLRNTLVAQALQKADGKRFWTAFGANTPLAAALLTVEPITGTLALISSVLISYAPTSFIKRTLDDHKYGDKSALANISMQLENLDAVTEMLQKRCRQIEQKHCDALLSAPQDHPLYRAYPDLRGQFHTAHQNAQQQAAEKAAQARDAAAKIKLPRNHRRFGL